MLLPILCLPVLAQICELMKCRLYFINRSQVIIAKCGCGDDGAVHLNLFDENIAHANEKKKQISEFE